MGIHCSWQPLARSSLIPSCIKRCPSIQLTRIMHDAENFPATLAESSNSRSKSLLQRVASRIMFLWHARGGPLDLRSDPPELEPRAVSDALHMLVRLRRARRSLSLSELVRAVLRETGLIELALSERHGEQAATNLLKLAEQAHAFAASGGGLRAFAARWPNSGTRRPTRKRRARSRRWMTSCGS